MKKKKMLKKEIGFIKIVRVEITVAGDALNPMHAKYQSTGCIGCRTKPNQIHRDDDGEHDEEKYNNIDSKLSSCHAAVHCLNQSNHAQNRKILNMYTLCTCCTKEPCGSSERNIRTGQEDARRKYRERKKEERNKNK